MRLDFKTVVVLNKNKAEYGYEYAYKLAREQLSSIADIEKQCLKSGAQCQAIDSKRTIITVKFLDQLYKISHPDIDISLAGREEEIPIRDRLLILHYLTQARGTALTNKIISYKELPEGTNYFPTFAKRAIKPVLGHFGKEPEQLVDIARKLGGHRIDYGDVAVTITAFPRVPITYVMWKGDEELPPEGNILFDSTIPDYLPTEDINVLCETIAWRLVKSYQQR